MEPVQGDRSISDQRFSPEKAESLSALPSEVLTAIFQNLSDEELLVQRGVDRASYNTIEGDRNLCNRVHFHIGLKKAKKNALSMKDNKLKDQFLGEIVKLEAKKDLNKAKKTALLIENKEEAVRAFFEFAKEDQKHDFTIARDIVVNHLFDEEADQWFCWIVQEQVKANDLTSAITTAGLITNPKLKDKAFLEIVKEQAKRGSPEVENTLQHITDIDSKDQARLEIVRHNIQNNPTIETIQSVWQIVQQIGDPLSKDLALEVIVKAFGEEGNFEEAKRVAKSISSESAQGLAFIAILEKEAKVDSAAAMQTAKLILDPLVAYGAPMRIVKSEASVNLQKAKQTAQTIEKVDQKDKALLEIVRHEAEINFQDALQTAESIQNEGIKDQAFESIMRVQIRNKDFDGAKQTARSIQGFESKNSMLYEVVAEEFKHSPEDALKTLETIDHPYFKDIAQYQIVKELLKQKNFDEAVTRAQGINLSTQKDQAFLEIVQALAKDNQIDAARQALPSIKDPNVQKKAALEGVKELVKIENFDAALNIAQAPEIDPKLKNDMLLEIVKGAAAKRRFDVAKNGAEMISDQFEMGRAFLEIAKGTF